ncbi:transcriptional regulator, LacI family [Filimonas lacunae]|uniref:Transcriptional regulator, LacI family n=1 Tax=Filimonas lacunae TaxID=477680 RepID=A0A173MNR0_9BACT|nr:LacI family DNA-binding transcriptional regulator [Filimonas lacunae]BAV09031.1 LacI family transcriptional regulator [Filimonas lacunae]SIS66101.1 transcriptional regulator, LacI family [Filimonas lacunae]
MATNVTITDIAKELNTTPATVSRALNNHSSISEETRARVWEVAKRLNYRPNSIATSLRSGKSHLIGVIIPSAKINFFGSVVHGIESLASEHGYNVLIYQTNESREHEKKGIQAFLNARVDGILVSMAKETHDYKHFLEARDSGTPIVFFDRANEDLDIASVVIDDYKGAYMATEHLIQQGYKRIAHIAGPQHIRLFNNRLRGYLGALQANNITIDSSLIYTGNISIEAGKTAIEHFLSLPNPPDAVFSVEDFTALGALKALKEHQILIPEQFGVIGFANEEFGEHTTPSLSTLDQQTVLMGEAAFTLLQEQINMKTSTQMKAKKVVLDPIPVYRQSSTRH